MTTYIRTPFALNGDVTIIPQTDTVTGAVNFNDGYGVKYSQDPNGAGLALLRPDMNYLLNIITANIQQYQQFGIPNFISASDNGGTAYSYAKNAIVRYDSGSGYSVYMSLVDANNTLPSDASKWVSIDPYNRLAERNNTALTGIPTAPTAPTGTSNTQIASTAFVDAAVSGASAPVSSIIAFAHNTPPTGWLKCNGAAISRAAYSNLFAAIGTTFGAGDGSTTFNLPDLRGEFVRGWDDGRGVDAGRAFGSAQADMFKSHTHSSNTAGVGTALGSSTHAQAYTGLNYISIGATGGSETRPRNIALLYCIKY